MTTPISSGKLAPSLIFNEEVLQSWIVNHCTIHLIRKGDSLKCKMVDCNHQILYQKNISLPLNLNIEEMIQCLKTCKVIIEDGTPKFRDSHKFWEVKDQQVYLLSDTVSLLWNIFQSSTESRYFPIRDVTIPSSRCHPETIALIEKIKKNSLDRTHINYLKKDFQVTRILSLEEINKEIIIMGYEQLDILESRDNQRKKDEQRKFGSQAVVGSTALYLARSTIGATTSIINSWLGGGILANIATGTVGLGLGVASVGLGMALPAIIKTTPYIKSFYCKETQKVKNIAERVNVLAIERPLFVEIEPISSPSHIDERIHVSKFTWAVTLITRTKHFGSHAQIIVEGLNDGYYDVETTRLVEMNTIGLGEKFIHISEFNPPVRSGLLPSDKFEFGTRTEIWMRPSHKVKEMLKDIEYEKPFPKGRLGFNLSGINSLLYKVPIPNNKFISKESGHNCFTWARDKLQMLDIDLGSSTAGAIITIPRTYTKPKEEYIEIPKQLI